MSVVPIVTTLPATLNCASFAFPVGVKNVPLSVTATGEVGVSVTVKFCVVVEAVVT